MKLKNDIIALLSKHPNGLKAKDIASILKVDKILVYRILYEDRSTFEMKNYVWSINGNFKRREETLNESPISNISKPIQNKVDLKKKVEKYVYIRASMNSKDIDKQERLFKTWFKEKAINNDSFVYVSEISKELNGSEFERVFIKEKNTNCTIYVTSIDRISRNANEIKMVLEDFKRKNIQIFCLDDNSYFTSEKLILAEIFESCSLMERTHFSNVTKNALDNLKKRGIKLGKKCSFGYPEYIMACEEREKGLTMSAISRKIGISKSVIHRWLKYGYTGETFDNINEELFIAVKLDIEEGMSTEDICKKHNITHQYLIRIREKVNKMKLDKKMMLIPLDLRQRIASEVNAGSNILEMSLKYNIDVEMIKLICNYMKGGANW